MCFYQHIVKNIVCYYTACMYTWSSLFISHIPFLLLSMCVSILKVDLRALSIQLQQTAAVMGLILLLKAGLR